MEETIELREIIEIILKGKWLIATITIICMLLSGVASWFVLAEKYESNAVVQVRSDVQDTGIISNYVAAEFKPNVYMQRVKNEHLINLEFQKEKLLNEYFENNLTTTNEPNTNLVNLTYISNSPENAQLELQTILNYTKKEMNASVQTALTELEATYKIQSESLSKEIEGIINNYNKLIHKYNLPEILILQTILNSGLTLEINEQQISALANVDGSLQNQLLQLQSQIQIKTAEYQSVLAEYQSVKTGLESFKPDPFIRVIADPTLPEEAASPNKVLNLAIGLVVGLIIGLGIVFFRNYWQDSAPVK